MLDLFSLPRADPITCVSLPQIKFNDENFPFTQLYKDYTSIEMVQDEEISPYLCDKCETVLVIAFNFRKAVKESSQFLNHIFEKITAYEDTVNGIIPNDERGRKVQELKLKIFSNSYCRFCYMESSSLNQLFGEDQRHKNQSLEEIFKTVARFTLASCELSARVCKSCLNQMLQIFDGCVTARKNDAYIKKSLSEAQNAIMAGTLKIDKYIYPKTGGAASTATASAAAAAAAAAGKCKKKFTPKRKIEKEEAPEDDHFEPPPLPIVDVMEPEFIKLEPIDADDPMNSSDGGGVEIKEETDVVPVPFNDPMSVKNETPMEFLDGEVEEGM